MVLRTDPGEVRLLPPIVPVLLSRRTASNYTFKPLASDNSGGASSSGSSTSSSSANSSSSSKDITVTNGSNLSRPSVSFPNFGRFGLGMGIGGAAYFGGTYKAVALWPFSKKKKATNNGRKRVLIAYSNTGGGHRASAEAIKQAFQEKYGDKYEIFIEDLWMNHTPAPWKDMPKSYSFMVKHSILWRLSYEMFQPKLIHVPYLRVFHACAASMLGKCMDAFNPDLVVSVHPLMQHILVRLLRDRIAAGQQQPINFATVVTDFTTCHNTWFHPQATRCFVPTEFCARLARRNGLQTGQIVLHGLPIRPVFSKKLAPKAKLKSQLGMEPGVPGVLLVGGGEGMGKLEETVDEMAAQLGNKCQVVVICGRNTELLSKLKAKRYASGMRVVPVGFVDNMHEYMGAVDAIVTKAGPGTIAEALIAGLPILLNGNVPCQEEGNIPYVTENKVGAFETSPPKIAGILAQWLLGPGSKQLLTDMSARSKELGRPEAVYKIVEDLAALADAPDFNFGPAAVAKRAGAASSVKVGKKQVAFAAA